MILLSKVYHRLMTMVTQLKYPNRYKNAIIDHRVKVYNPHNLIMEELTNIDAGAVIMNTRAKFIMKKNSGAAFGLIVVTGNHMSVVGLHFKQVTDKTKDALDLNHKMDQDVIVDEDVWIGSRVTLLAGSHICRGCEIGSNSVIRGTIPPYCIVVGNPAKVIGFRFTPEEIIEHEVALYDEKERLPIELLEKNYQKYFISRIKDINTYLRI